MDIFQGDVVIHFVVVIEEMLFRMLYCNFIRYGLSISGNMTFKYLINIELNKFTCDVI